MCWREFETTSKAYLATLDQLLSRPDCRVGPRGQGTRELLNWGFTVTKPSSDPIVTASQPRNQKIASYLEAEKRLYLTGERQVEAWARGASKFWERVANPDGTIESNYGWLTFYLRDLPDGLTSWDWAKRRLLEDRYTRQAYLRVSRPSNQREGIKDLICTMHCMFLIRDGKLNLTTVMRSNDVVRGLVYDMPWWCLVQATMVDQLNKEGVPTMLGSYSHLAHSMHLYDRDKTVAREMLGA